MYISRRIAPSGYTYSICESYYDHPYYRSRVLFELGSDPTKFITYYSDVAFSIDLEEELAKQGIKTDQFELEELFYRFLTPSAQRWVTISINRRRNKDKPSQSFDSREFHWFDRIRLIVLKLDHRQPKRILDERLPFFGKLLKKSRDEIENMIWDMEDRLTFRERVRYFYAVFELMNYVDTEERDGIFLEIICSLSKDPNYLMGLETPEVLRNYLSRYIWQYFDLLPVRRVPRVYEIWVQEVYEDVSQILNIPVETLFSLSRKDILKMFRIKIKELHPDKGGDHEAFIRLRRIMETFLKLHY